MQVVAAMSTPETKSNGYREDASMAVAVIMPRQGNTVESCIITEWKKKPGDAVAVGDI